MHDEILMSYYANNAEKLRRMTDRILHKFGGWSNKVWMTSIRLQTKSSRMF